MVGGGDDLAKGDSDSSTGSESSTTDEGETDEGETGDGLSEECYGGEPRGPFWGEIQPVVIDEEIDALWSEYVTLALTCTVDAYEHDDSWGAVTLACEGDATLELFWSIPAEYGLLDAS